MLRRSNSRRRSRGVPYLCIAASLAVLLLLLSLFALHSRLSTSPSLPLPLPSFLPDDADNDAFDAGSEDRIDIGDVDDNDADAHLDDDGLDDDDSDRNPSASGHFWDHVLGVKRRAFGGKKVWDGDFGVENGGGEVAFSSDDLPVDEEIRVRLGSVRGVEEALLVRSSKLRDGWAKWFELKGRFLRQDKMFGRSLEALNPMNHPLLQDPDVTGATGLTRGDRFMRKAMWKEIEKVAFGDVKKRVERRALNSEVKVKSDGSHGRSSRLKEQHVYPDGRRWGYYPGFDPNLSFSAFVAKFLGDERCSLRVFMVWNSPSWSYGVRHQRGLESLFHHHKDACVVVFTEMMELDFFHDFAKDGFRVALAMPNLDELLKDTPILDFASFWHEWRKTKYYSLHYSELIRLAVLYKYGGIYLDSDIIVLKPLSSVQNSIGVENTVSEKPMLNGAVMAFESHSPFIMECMKEYYSTYDDTKPSWNGAELLTRVFSRFSSGSNKTDVIPEFNPQDPHLFFPINSHNITRYFHAAEDDFERKQHEVILTKILDQSITFHFWNSITSALVPEPGSIVEKIINRHCIYCLDVL